MRRKVRPVIRIVRMDGEIRRLADRAFADRRALGELEDSWTPAADVFERRERLVVEIEVPGLRVEEITIALVPSRIEVRGVKREAPLSPDARYLRIERGYGAFRRSIPLPYAVVPEGARASLENGVLTVVMRKHRPRRDREVKVRIQRSDA